MRKGKERNMMWQRFVYMVVATATQAWSGDLSRRRDERGLSQSTENVILLVGAVAVAASIITAVTTFITGHLVLTAP